MKQITRLSRAGMLIAMMLAMLVVPAPVSSTTAVVDDESMLHLQFRGIWFMMCMGFCTGGLCCKIVEAPY